MTSSLVNISRNEVVEALRGANALLKADNDALASAIDVAMDNPSPTTQIDPVIMQMVTDTLIEVTADSLILGDRSQPLVRRELMLEPFQIALRSAKFDVDEGLMRAINDALDSLGTSFVDIIDEAQGAPEKSHAHAWAQVNAYRQLTTEHGTVDPDNQELRDEFIRFSSSEAEWVEQTEKLAKTVSASIRKMVDAIIDSILRLLAAQDGLSADDIAKLKDEMTPEMDDMLTELTTRSSRAIQAYRDRRFMEIWVIPGLNGGA